MDLVFFVVLGFLAQLVDGALGMGFGVITTSFLLGFGIAPASASAAVHVAKVVTGGASGISHAMFGNVDRKLALRLVAAGMIGGVIGAYLLVSVDGQKVKPFIAVYLLLMGLLILRKALRPTAATSGHRAVVPLGFVGGLLDAIGGGGWGPIVTSTLIAGGTTARIAVGSVNLAEFAVAVAISVAFFATIGFGYWRIIAGLVIGGIVAAPLAAYLSKRISARPMLIAVGICIVLLSCFTITETVLDTSYLESLGIRQ
ncbi:MAG: sulfite exporter TauE/SafE family protein [Dongiaceae bacterium]